MVELGVGRLAPRLRLQRLVPINGTIGIAGIGIRCPGDGGNRRRDGNGRLGFGTTNNSKPFWRQGGWAWLGCWLGISMIAGGIGGTCFWISLHLFKGVGHLGRLPMQVVNG